MKKSLKIAIISVCAVLAAAGICAGVYFGCIDPTRGTVKDYQETLPLDWLLTRKQAEDDLEFVMEHLRGRHPAWLEENEVMAAAEAQYQTELVSLSDVPSVEELWRAAARITSVMHDGHTLVYASLPGRYVNDFDSLRNSGTLVAINGEAAADIFARARTLFPYETDEYAIHHFSSTVLMNEKYLRLVGVDTSNGVVYTFEKDGETTDISYDLVPIEEVTGYDGGDSKWVYYDIDTENSIGIFTLTECTYNDEYKAVVKEFFEAVKKNGICDIIVDLRGNGGGNSMVADEFLRYIDIDSYYGWASKVRYGNFLRTNERCLESNEKLEPPFGGNIYLLTNVFTYSAAMDFAMLVGDNDIGVIIGEASGNLPDSYGDSLSFRLPNSKLDLNVSFKKWYRVDESKAGQPIEPDHPCDPNDALEKAYELINESR